MKRHAFLYGWLTLLVTAGTALAGEPGARGIYRMLPGEPGGKLPFGAVDFTFGPREEGGQWWELRIRAADEPDAATLAYVRALTTEDPMTSPGGPQSFLRYQLQIPETSETIEYRNVHTGRPQLPAWQSFTRYFFPQPARATRYQNGLANTCEYLGHILTLNRTNTAPEWKPWTEVKVLNLDPELLIGTGRSARDAEGKRLPQHPERRNYTYIPFNGDDYRTMIDAGFNMFTIKPNQEKFVRSEPVFYLRGVGGDPKLRYPADLYRANYIGDVMFMDEPTCIMIGDKNVHNTLRYFTDATNLLTKRVRARFMSAGHYGALNLHHELKSVGISMGDMVLAEVDYPAWETVFESAWYQLAGGLAGIVHEGRYQLAEFNRLAKASTGNDREYTAEEMFQYIYGTLRGAARHFDKDWGTSIYGQADPKLSPLAMRMAYDMGARYLWYWTSDHDHHLPWPEQLELTRLIRKHAAEHPRPSIRAQRPVIDKLIQVPYGYYITLESPTNRKENWDLWWIRELDPEGKNEASQRYRRLVQGVMREVNAALDAKETFDISVDDGRTPSGYKRVVKVSAE